MGLLPSLPKGFNPMNMWAEVGDTINPFNGDTNYDIFSQLGQQSNGGSTTSSGQVQGASTDPYAGALYYDTNNNNVGQYQGNGQYGTAAPIDNAPGSTPTYSTFNTGQQQPAAPVDPNPELTAFMKTLGGSVSNIKNNAFDAFGSGSRNLRGQAESLFNTFKQGQSGIDRSRENIEMNRLAGVDDILSFVRNGLRSGSNMLSNMNALDSSAARSIAEAYGGEANTRMRQVGNSTFLQIREQDQAQENLDLQLSQGTVDLNRLRDEVVSNVGQQIRADLANLESQASRYGGSTGLDIESEKQRIIDEGMSKLNDVSSWLSERTGSVKPAGTADIKKNAQNLRMKGTADITPFEFGNFNSNLQAGPAIDQLPIYVRRKNQ